MKKLAEGIILAQRIREESYDKEAAALETQRSLHDPSCRIFVDYSQFYRKTLSQAADKACLEVGLGLTDSEFISRILFVMWNDAADWAKRRCNDSKACQTDQEASSGRMV